jgi:hypothetical protein
MRRDFDPPSAHESIINEERFVTGTLTVRSRDHPPGVVATVIHTSTSTVHITPTRVPATTPTTNLSLPTATDEMEGIHYCPAVGRGGFVYTLCSPGHKSTSGMLTSVNAIVQTPVPNGGRSAGRVNNAIARLLG